MNPFFTSGAQTNDAAAAEDRTPLTERLGAAVAFRVFAHDSREYHAAIRLRKAVLREPLGLSFTPEELADEPACFHLGAFQAERLIAVLLLKPLGSDEVKMRQVAVEPEFQGRGIGTGLVAFAEHYAKERGYRTIRAHARESAAEFYGKAGYRVSGERFIENTIPHQLVTKRL